MGRSETFLSAERFGRLPPSLRASPLSAPGRANAALGAVAAYSQYVIMINMRRRDPSLDTLLDLDGQVLVIDEAGYWVKFAVHQVPASDDKPHGLDYTLTMHGPDGGAPGRLRQRPPGGRAGQGRRQGPPAPAAYGQAL